MQSNKDIIQQRIKYPTGQTGVKYYSIGELLGKGGFAKCYRGVDLESQKQIAIKVVEKAGLIKNRAKQKLLSQIKIHKALKHPYIVEFQTVFEDQKNVYIILQLCPCRTLSEMVKRRKFLTPMETRFYIIQLLSALQYLHSNKVIHRDLKMGNIFLNGNMDMKLGDFGLSAKLEFCDEKKRTMAGTPNYIAPEIIEGTGGHSYQVDLWSTGVICYALLYGRPPFQTAELKMTYSKIKNCQYSFPSHHQIPLCAKDFIQNILILDPKKRMTIQEMLEHPFLKDQVPIRIPKTALTEIPTFDKQDYKGSESSNRVSFNSFNEPRNTNTFKEKQVNVLRSKQTNKEQTRKLVVQSDKLIDNPTNRLSTPSKEQYIPLSVPIGITSTPSKTYNKQNENFQVEKDFQIYVISHVDYSTKYGLGYYLNNSSYGVYYNDSTILSIDSEAKNFYYIINPSHRDQTIEKYSLNQLPNQRNYTKKKLLLQKFQTHLLDQISSQNQAPKIEAKQTKNHIYVRQWLKTKHAVMFRLSNKIFQVNFQDKSQILLNTDARKVVFTNKKGQKCKLSLTQALSQQWKDTQLGRRIKYTRQILNSLKRGRNSDGQNSGGDQSD